VSTRHLGVTLAACLLVLGLPAARARVHAENVPEEYRLKAAFVYRFPQFVEWPPASWTGREALEICVSQPNPFGSSLAEFVEGESLKGKRFVVRQVTAKGRIESCHVLFVAQPEATKSGLLARAASLPILTVGDSPRFLDLGGIINLRLVDRRVRFEINLAAADRAGLRLSSQLLRLAMTVRGGRS
jgi:hypothetical protein